MAKEKSEPRHLYRSKSSRFIAGVCVGIGDYFQIDVNIIRIIFIILSFAGGVGIILYITGIIILPENSDESGVATQKVSNSLIFGFIFIAIGGFLLLREFGIIHYFRFFNFSLVTVWGILLIAIGILLLFQSKKEPKTTEIKENIDNEIDQKKIYRSRHDKMLAGICGGLGKYFDIDPSFIRIGWVLATFFSVGAGLLVYVILIFIFPEEPLENSS
jgi:phage shock protein C